MLAMQWTYTPPGGHVPVTPSNPYGLPLSIPVDGVDPASQQLGPLSQARVISGRGLNASDAGATWRSGRRLRGGAPPGRGSVISLARHDFRVVGIVEPARGHRTGPAHPDPLAQALSGFRGEITSVDVAVRMPPTSPP